LKTDLKSDFKHDKAFVAETHLEKKELSPEREHKGLGTKIKEMFTGHS